MMDETRTAKRTGGPTTRGQGGGQELESLDGTFPAAACEGVSTQAKERCRLLRTDESCGVTTDAGKSIVRLAGCTNFGD